MQVRSALQVTFCCAIAPATTRRRESPSPPTAYRPATLRCSEPTTGPLPVVSTSATVARDGSDRITQDFGLSPPPLPRVPAPSIPPATTMTEHDGNPDPPSRPQREFCSVPAARLADRGDINRSYSADLIATSGRVRRRGDSYRNARVPGCPGRGAG